LTRNFTGNIYMQTLVTSTKVLLYHKVTTEN